MFCIIILHVISIVIILVTWRNAIVLLNDMAKNHIVCYEVHVVIFTKCNMGISKRICTPVIKIYSFEVVYPLQISVDFKINPRGHLGKI